MSELRAAARAARPSGLIDLSRSEPLAMPLPSVCADQMLAEFTRARSYCPPAGLAMARQAIAREAAITMGIPVATEQVVATSGATAGMMLALSALVPLGGEVLVALPFYSAHPKQIEAMGGRVRFIDTRGSGGRLNADLVARALGPQSSALLVVNPANPTGIHCSRDELADIVAVLPPHVAVIGDEVYREFIYEGEATSLLRIVHDEGANRPVVVLTSASKSAGMPGWRVGSAIASVAIAERMARASGSLSGPPSTMSQVAYAAWLGAPKVERMAPYRPRLRDSLEVLRGAGLSVTVPGGGYYLWVTAPFEMGASDRVLDLARSAGVLVGPGVLYGDPCSVRISLSVPRDELRRGLAAVVEALSQ